MHAILLRQAQTQSFMHFLHSRTRAHGVLSIRKGGPTVSHACNAFHKSARSRTYLADKRLSSVSTTDRRNHGDNTISVPFLFLCHSLVRCTGFRDLLDLIVGMQQLDMFLNDRLSINIRSGKEEYVSSVTSTISSWRHRVGCRRIVQYVPNLLGKLGDFRSKGLSSRCEHCRACLGGLVLLWVLIMRQ
jgi:hypothetical protein